MAITFTKDTRFLFAGGAATDSGRLAEPEGIGHGFVRIIRDYLRAKHPPLAPACINRGFTCIGMADLAARWEQDVVAERPDVVSILIDVDDHSRRPPHSTPGDCLDQFRTVYRHILAATARDLPRSEIILFHPPALWSHAAIEADQFLKPYVDSLEEIAREFQAYATVPLHSAFVYARRNRPDIQWATGDGQLNSSSHMIIAYTWMEVAGITHRAFS
jgi:acyl-CoA thioesterase I